MNGNRIAILKVETVELPRASALLSFIFIVRIRSDTLPYFYFFAAQHVRLVPFLLFYVQR